MSMQDPLVDNPSPDWNSNQELLAKDTLAVLYKYYPGYKWGIEFPPCNDAAIGLMVIRLLDIPTDLVYTINEKDIDRASLRCVMRAGGAFLEALGLPTKGARHGADRVRGLKRTPSGLIIPDHAAMPDTNPGHALVKKRHELFNKEHAERMEYEKLIYGMG